SVPNQLTITWNVTNLADGSLVNFAVVLTSDGRIRFDYGAGNTNLHPIIGLSQGNNQAYRLSSYSGQARLTSPNSTAFDLASCFTDIGAYEFRGNSLDSTPPGVTVSRVITVDTGATAFTQIQVPFSEDVNPIDANAPANYALRSPSPARTSVRGAV